MESFVQVAVLKSAADKWIFIDEETESIKRKLEEEKTRIAAEKAIPKSMRKRVSKPWVSLVSSSGWLTRLKILPVHICTDRKADAFLEL